MLRRSQLVHWNFLRIEVIMPKRSKKSAEELERLEMKRRKLQKELISLERRRRRAYSSSKKELLFNFS